LEVREWRESGKGRTDGKSKEWREWPGEQEREDICGSCDLQGFHASWKVLEFL